MNLSTARVLKSYRSFLALLIGGTVVLFSFQNCGPAKMGFSGSRDSSSLGLGVNANNSQTPTCPAGQVAIGLQSSGQILCVPYAAVPATVCPVDSYLYSHDANGVASCVKISDRDPSAGLCDYNREVESYDPVTGNIVCVRMPGVRPNYNCPVGEWVLSTHNGVVVCSGSNNSSGNPNEYSCPLGQYIARIENGRAICENSLPDVSGTLRCSGDRAIVGLDDRDQVVCQQLMPPPHPESVCPAGQFAQAQAGGTLTCAANPVVDLVRICPAGKFLSTVSSAGSACLDLPTPDSKFNGSCPPGQFLMGYENGQTVCVSKATPELTDMCPNGTYLNRISGSIYVCIPYSDQNPCQVGYTLENGQCVDRTKPVVTITKAPVSGTSTSAVVEFTVEERGSGVATQICKLDGNQLPSCQSPVSMNQLNVGAHVFEVTVTDKAGNSDSKQANWTVSPAVVNCNPGFENVNGTCVDKTAPVIIVTKKPDNTTSSTTADIQFVVTEVGSGLKYINCVVDSQDPVSCTNSIKLSQLQPGLHVVKINAEDKSGNTAQAVVQWTVSSPNCPAGYVYESGQCKDRTAPTVKITSGPDKVTSSTDAKFEFTASDAGSGIAKIECQLDNGAFAPCASPVNVSGISVGNHVGVVKVTDKSGNSATDSYSWTVKLCKAGEVKACQVANGLGQMTCQADGNSYGACVPTACEAGYKLVAGVCLKDENPPGSEPVCSNGNKKSFFVAKWTPLESRLAESCQSGVEIWNVTTNKQITIKSNNSGGSYVERELEIDYATYRAANAMKITAVLKDGSQKVIFEPCLISTHADTESKCLSDGRHSRPIEEAIRDFRVKVPKNTVEIRILPKDSNTPWYMRIRGLCEFAVSQPKYTSPLKGEEKYKVIGSDKNEKECRVTFETGGYWCKQVKNNKACEDFRDEVKKKYPHKRRSHVRCGGDRLND